MKNYIWKKIEEFNRYEVNNFGQIKNIETNRILKSYVASTGYVKCEIQQKDLNGIIVYKRISVHRLIAEYFIPNPNNCKIVNHINGIKSDNRIENLEWCSQKYNMHHAKNIIKTNRIISSKKILELYNQNMNYSKEEFMNKILSECQ